jgi:hypothetical protein
MVFHIGLRLFEFVGLGRPHAVDVRALHQDFVGQHADGVEEIKAIAVLVAQAENGDFLAIEVHLAQARKEHIPVILQFACVPGGDAHDDVAVLEDGLGRRRADVVDVDQILLDFVEFGFELIRHRFGFAGAAAKKQANFRHRVTLEHSRATTHCYCAVFHAESQPPAVR